MNDKHDARENAEETLMTLRQLSQTLEIMSSMVDRLTQLLDNQLSQPPEQLQKEQQSRRAEQLECLSRSEKMRNDSHIVEITQSELEESSDPTLH